MATSTVSRGRLKPDVLDAASQVVRPVTISAGHNAMSPEKRKISFGMVKFHHVLPCFEVVAAEAPFFTSVGRTALPVRRKLPPVGIFVTGLTFKNPKFVLYRWKGILIHRPSVTFHTRNSGVSIR